MKKFLILIASFLGIFLLIIIFYQKSTDPSAEGNGVLRMAFLWKDPTICLELPFQTEKEINHFQEGFRGMSTIYPRDDCLQAYFNQEKILMPVAS